MTGVAPLAVTTPTIMIARHSNQNYAGTGVTSIWPETEVRLKSFANALKVITVTKATNIFVSEKQFTGIPIQPITKTGMYFLNLPVGLFTRLLVVTTTSIPPATTIHRMYPVR